MRSADRRLPAVAAAVAAVLVALSGCNTVPGILSGSGATAPEVAANAASAPQAAAVPNATSASEMPAAPRPLAVVRPEAQRAFDAALADLRANRAADAERGFRALAQSDPDLAGPHANLGVIARRAGRLPEAVAELERAVALDAQQPATWNELGIAERESGAFAKARDAYEHALALDANYAPAVLNLGILDDLYLGDGDAALALYNRYLALTPAGDAPVTKWVADLNNRRSAAAKAASAPASAVTDHAAPKEKS